jgi:hypothetical protein
MRKVRLLELTMPSVEGIPPKYKPLHHFLIHKCREGHKCWQTTFEELEAIIGAPLPDSARRSPLFWSNLRQSGRASTAWYRAGWKTSMVKMQA